MNHQLRKKTVGIIPEVAKCNLCKEVKNNSEFNKCKSNKNGLQKKCRSCQSKLDKEYRKNNKETLLEKQRKYRKSHPEKVKQYNDTSSKNTVVQRRKYALLYYRKNKKAIMQRLNKYCQQRLLNDELFALKFRIRNSINKALRRNGFSKNKNTEEILGCTYQYFKEYIESKFTDGMNWENRNLWHIDHIIPLDCAKTEEDVYVLNHYTNLQPLWAEDNLAKSNKLI